MKNVDVGMWLYVSLCAILLCLMMACSAPRKTQTNIERHLEMHDGNEQTEQKNRELVERMTRKLFDALLIVTDTEVEQVRTDLSVPDSTGVQYPTAVTRTKAVSRSTGERKREEQTGKDTQASEAVTVTSKDTTTVTAVEQVSTREEQKRRLSWWQSALIFLGGLMVVYVAFKMFLKKKQP